MKAHSPISIRHKLQSLSLFLVLTTSILGMATTLLFSLRMEYQNLDRNLMNSAQVLAQSPDVADFLAHRADSSVLTHYLNGTISRVQDIDAIVVADHNGVIRYCPDPAFVGTVYPDVDTLTVLRGELTEVDGPEGTGREGEPTMAAALAYVFSGRDSAELWGCKDPGSGPWIELLYRQELATLQEWVRGLRRGSGWTRRRRRRGMTARCPPYGSYTIRLLSDGDIILHWNSPYVAVYLDGEGQIWRCTSGYDQLYRSLAERWAWKVAQGTPGYFSALTDEDGPPACRARGTGPCRPRCGGGGHGGSDLDAGGARPGGGAGGRYRHRRLRILPHDLLPWESGLLLHG